MKKSSNEIVKMEFMGTPVECVIKDGIKYISVTSISNAIGVENDTIRKLIGRNSDTFDGLYIRDTVSRMNGSPIEQVCLSRDGIIGLMFMINTKSYPEDKRQTIIKFKKWATTVLGEAYEKQFLSKASGLLADNWDEQREITKQNHYPLMQAVHDTYESHHENGVVPRRRYMEENIMINETSMGHHRRGMRNKASIKDLARVSLAIGADIVLHELEYSDIGERKNIIGKMLNKYHKPNEQSQLSESSEDGDEILEKFM